MSNKQFVIYSKEFSRAVGVGDAEEFITYTDHYVAAEHPDYLDSQQRHPPGNIEHPDARRLSAWTPNVQEAEIWIDPKAAAFWCKQNAQYNAEVKPAGWTPASHEPKRGPGRPKKLEGPTEESEDLDT